MELIQLFGLPALFMFLLFLAYFDFTSMILPTNITRQTPHGPVFSKCKLYGGRFYGFGGGCDEPLSWPDILILGCLSVFIYKVIYK